MPETTKCSQPQLGQQKEFHIAPMLDVSTIEFRYFMRLLSKRAILWTEMTVAETLVYRSQHNSLDDTNIQLDSELMRHCGWFDERHHYDGSCVDMVNPHPIVCQIGTNNPKQAAFATRVVQACGYDRIDLNAECPSDRVSGREFGAALMRDKDTAIDVIRSMVQTSESFEDEMTLPVSIKTRIGVDDFDSFEHLFGFVESLIDAGCKRFVIHARKVYTQGLSPAQNRTVPPLNYPFVYQLIQRFPQCDFWLNGGIMNLQHAKRVAYGQVTVYQLEDTENSCIHEKHSVPCDQCNMSHGSCIAHPEKNIPNLRGVMVGRLARDNPAALADVDRYFFGEATNPCSSRRDLMEKYIQFIERIYPRRCCDDDDVISSRMVMDMQQLIVHNRQCCSICQEFLLNTSSGLGHPDPDEVNDQNEVATYNDVIMPDQTDTKRRKRHIQKYGNAKIVSGVIDSAIQPTLSILYGQRGNNLFRRELHRLSRDMKVRNCGPSYILRKAMAAIPTEVWEKPFALNDTSVHYIPSR